MVIDTITAKTLYEGSKANIAVICPEHGEFMIIAADHIGVRRRGCSECGRLASIRAHTKTTEEFIAEARCVHGEKYDYSRVIYKSAHEKVEILDHMGKVFWQKPANHLAGHDPMGDWK